MTLHTSTMGMFSRNPTFFTASAYDFVTSKWRSSLIGGSLAERLAFLWYVSTGGGVRRMTAVSGEYSGDEGDLTICTRRWRFLEYLLSGTCCGENSRHESLPPSQMVKKGTPGVEKHWT